MAVPYRQGDAYTLGLANLTETPAQETALYVTILDIMPQARYDKKRTKPKWGCMCVCV